MGKTSSIVKDRYNAKAYDEIKIRVPKGHKAEIQAHASGQGESLNGFIGRAIAAAMAQDLKQPLKAVIKRENSSGVELPSEIEKAAKMAAERTGESISEFIARAIEIQLERDAIVFRMGTNPATGKDLAQASGEKPADAGANQSTDGQAEK